MSIGRPPVPGALSPVSPDWSELGGPRSTESASADHRDVAAQLHDPTRSLLGRFGRAWTPSGYASGEAFERITVNAQQMGGLPCIRGMRVTVSAVIGQLAAGRTIADVLADYPYLEREDVLAALEYAAAAVSERELPSPMSA